MIAAWPLIALVLAYRYLVSPVLGSNCRFAPTCSRYALQALTRHGLVTGARLAVWRVMRCHPWGGGGYDPVPDHASRPAERRTGDPARALDHHHSTDAYGR